MSTNSIPFRRLSHVVATSAAIALLFAASSAMAQTEANLQAVTIKGKALDTLDPKDTAPSQGDLDARSAKSTVNDNFIRNFTSPIADYTQVVQMTPGVFAYTPNGVGLGDAKVTLRGLSDSFTVFSFDGIPFNDTNGVSHHSWVFFPSQFLGGAVVDRSPGGAATIGQATFGGAVDLRSRVLSGEARTTLSASAASWNTRQIGIERETGAFGADGKSDLLFNIQKMKSDGYETYNKQDRFSWSGKYQYNLDAQTTFTAFAAALELKNNTPNIKGVSRALYNSGDYVDMLSNDPTLGNYQGYNFYDVKTDFEYVGINTTMANGWKLDDKLYRYNYHNKQNYSNSAGALPSLPNLSVAGTDKLNSYITTGNLLRLSRDSSMGTLRTGLWVDQAESYRYQTPSNPQTWVDATLPNFTENYTTVTFQPYVEFEFKVSDALSVTPGVKYAQYRQDFVHLQDNGGAVGLLGGTAATTVNKVVTTAKGGATSLSNNITYTDWMPSLDVRYKIRPNWTTYAQYAIGDQIPSTSVFDVKNALVSPPPKATKATTVQVGTVWNDGPYTVSADIYHTKLDGAYTALPVDANGNVGYALSGTEVNQGLEAEANIALGSGFSLYANATFGSLKFANGQYVAGAPKDTQTIAINYQRDHWAVNLSANRVGRMYNDGKDAGGAVQHQWFTIDPVVVTNLFVNYTVPSASAFIKKTKLQMGVNNLFNRHDIVGIASSVTGSSSINPNVGDLLTILPGRSLSLTATLDF